MYNFTREDIDLEAIRARIAQMTGAEYGRGSRPCCRESFSGCRVTNGYEP